MSELEQDTTDTKDLENVAASLVQETILKHKDKVVKIYAACCLADIIRIFAPDAPYDDSQLKDIFKLFIEQLGHLDTDNDLYDLYVYLLERLVLVKAFVLLVELDQDLVVKLFKTLFKVISSDHSETIKTHFLDIMVSCFEESTEIPQKLLETIFRTLISPFKLEEPEALKLTQTLIRRFSTLLQSSISDYLLSCRENNTTESDIKGHYYELIFELNRISSSVITKVLPLLENELKIEEQSIRLNTVNLLHLMFGAQSSTLSTNYRPLFSVFLSRFHDKDTEIRLNMIEFAKLYLINHNTNIQDINDNLKSRIMDPEKIVREKVVTVVCGIAQVKPDSITNELITNVIERLQDKKKSVRKVTIRKLSELYVSLCIKYGEDTKTWPDDCIAKFAKIPMKLLYCYFLPNLLDKFRVEKIIDTVLLQGDLDTRTKRFTKLFETLDVNAITAINRILKEKINFQVGFKKLIEMRRHKRDDETEEEIAKQVSSLSNKFPNPEKARDGLMKIFNLKDEETIKLLNTLAESQIKYTALKTTKTDVLKKLETKKVPYFKRIVNHLTLTLITNDTIGLILNNLKSLSTNKREYAIIIQLIEEISNCYPNFFVDSLSNLDFIFKLINKKDDAIVNKIVNLICNIAATLTKNKDDDKESIVKDIKNKLQNLVINGTPYQAKQSIKSIYKITGNKSDSVFKTLLKQLIPLLKSKEKQLDTALKSIGYIAEYQPSLIINYKEQILSFIEQLLAKSQQQKKKNNNNNNEPSSECETKILSIKLLVHYLKSTEEEEDLGIVLLLFKIIKNSGEIASDENTSEIDKGYLTVTAANGILTLCMLPYYEKIISPDQFQLLSYVIQHPLSFVRSSFAKKLHKVLNTFKVPIRFLSIFSLCATDTDKSTLITIKQYFNNSIKLRRDYYKNHESDISNKPTLLTTFLPDYSLPYVIYLIAHHKLFDKDKNNNTPKYDIPSRYLVFYLEHLNFNTNNYIYLINLLHGISLTKDKSNNSSLNIQILCEIGTKYLMKKNSNNASAINTSISGSNNNNNNNSIIGTPMHMYLPPSLYELPTDEEYLQQQSNKSHLPIDFQLPTNTTKKSTTTVNNTTNVQEQKSKNKEEVNSDNNNDVSDDDEDKENKAEKTKKNSKSPATKSKTKKENKKQSNKKKTTSESENEEEENNNKKKKDKKNKKQEEQKEEDEEEEQPLTRKNVNRKRNYL